ncbi:GntR family transcriptional regulator [Vagococcus salmoninarum]|uniref:GntR family transcriptional regulator n=1 Tax=Vagococcus salmoninarum TaxID=2739 RepID=A0A429ZJT0_9ENTE|nr:GntR family transcriptional regulator [Vagococcus salmoninarum]RST93957.1 GntR family transcriptional regulator [Vagococcus salmoninarum]
MVIIDKQSKKPFYEQVVLGIKEEILQGLLVPGEKIPSVREMASQLMMNPNTISKAYKSLEEQGVITTVQGRGTFVKELVASRGDEEKIAKIKGKMLDLVIEARYLNVELPEMITWLSETADDLGGTKNES